MENCHSCVAVSSSEPCPHQTALHSLYQHGEMRPEPATAAPSWLLQTLPRGDGIKAPAFIHCFHRQRVSLLGDSLLLQEDHVALGQLNLPSTRPEGANVRNVVCSFMWFIKPTKRFVLAKEHRGAMKRAEWHQGIISVNCFINLESNNCLLNKALLFCFAIVLWWLPRKALTLKASQGLCKCCLWL